MEQNLNVKEEIIKLIDKRQKEILEAGVDWVYQRSDDLIGKRPKAETAKFAPRLFLAYRDILASGDYTKLHEFIDYIVAYRSVSEFRVSTIQRGFLALFKVLFAMLEEERRSPAFLVEADKQLDALYEAALFELSDKYQAAIEKLLKEKIEQLKITEVNLEETVQERTGQLAKRVRELEKFHTLTVGRELKMIELKKELAELKKKMEITV